MHDDVWHEAIVRRDQALSRPKSRLREGIEVVGHDTPAGSRMVETLAFFEFIQKEAAGAVREMARVQGREQIHQCEAANANGALRK